MNLVALPILIPLFSAILALFAKPYPRVQKTAAIAGAVAKLVVASALMLAVKDGDILVLQLGSWPAPFGITLVVDALAALMLLITALTTLAVAVYSLADIDAARVRYSYYPLLHIMIMGVNGAFLTGDVFNLYVWFEVMLISSFVLMTLGGERPQMEGAVKYVTLNLLSSLFFLTAAGVLYGLMGTLNMADLAVKFHTVGKNDLVNISAMLFLTAFGIKAGLFPLFFWLPSSYHTPPPAVSAIFAGLLTKVGMYALLRFFTLIFTTHTALTHDILLYAAAALTMLTGVLGAVAQYNMRRLLSFHIISQIGYMVMGLALAFQATPLALAGAIFYIFHHILVKSNLFLIAGNARRLCGTENLREMGGLYSHAPWLALLFLIPAMSLAGIPPLSGFWAKLILIIAAIESSSWLLLATALVVGFLTLYSMTKIWNEAFWKPQPNRPLPRPAPLPLRQTLYLYAPVTALALGTLYLGLQPEPLFEFCLMAARQLLHPQGYIDAVLTP